MQAARRRYEGLVPSSLARPAGRLAVGLGWLLASACTLEPNPSFDGVDGSGVTEGALDDGTADDGAADDGAPSSGDEAGGEAGSGGDVGSDDATPPCLADTPTNCGGECVDVSQDRRHCGGCDAPCLASQGCGQGKCRDCSQGELWCDDTCVDIWFNSNHCGACGVECKGGLVCQKEQCVCAAGLETCGADCVDLRSDRDNCGKCGVQCGTEPCIEGECGD